MDPLEQRLRATHEQYIALLQFMESHGDISKPQVGAQGRLKSDNLWSQLTNLLNSIGGGVAKPQNKWKKVWADWKCKTKKKCMAIKNHASGTGGGPHSRQLLNALEERIINLMGETAVVGLAGVEEQGLNIQQSTSQAQPVSEFVAFVQTSESVPELSPPASPQLLAPPVPPAPTTPSTSRRRPLSPTPSPRARRRRRVQTPFERAASEFVAVEQRRLQFEEERDRRLFELENRRLDELREHRRLLHSIVDLGQKCLEYLSKNNK